MSLCMYRLQSLKLDTFPPSAQIPDHISFVRSHPLFLFDVTTLLPFLEMLHNLFMYFDRCLQVLYVCGPQILVVFLQP